MTLPDQLRAVIEAAGIEFHMIMERVLYDSVLDVPLRESNIRLNGAAYELSKIFDDRIYWKRAAEIEGACKLRTACRSRGVLSRSS